ncbi:hypothetical protein TrCOL_g9005 [Triparma columacea]|uniref:IPT/TIG domain-containing protein n=1 Tax=Triparma columacea TaxID=722753 RepID=A0A9W7G319_9STRA|nr:hypothetical protein TrCOL_g9005 [Triparma columacea]
MLIEAAYCSEEVVRETLNLPPDTTLCQTLYDVIKQTARSRVGMSVDASVFFGEVLLPADTSTLQEWGISAASKVFAVLSPVPQVTSCSPCQGPEGGGTAVRLKGRGFVLPTLGGSGMASSMLVQQVPAVSAQGEVRVLFGTELVKARRISDSELCVVSPPHEAGIVTVRCPCARGSVDGSDSDLFATFQFVRLENLYDAIFASTNSHCPVRDMAQQAPGTVAPEEDESSGSAAAFSEQLSKKESD